ALATSASTIDAATSGKAVTTPAATPDAKTSAETTAVAADPAIAAAVNAPAKPTKFATASTGAESTDVAKGDAKVVDAVSGGPIAPASQPGATSAAPHAAAAAGAAPAKSDAAAGETVVAPAAHERHAASVQANASDAAAPTFTPVQHAAPTTTTPAAAPQFTVVASQTAPVPLNALAMQIAATAAGGKTSFDIRLDPAELGRIDVRLDVDRNGNVTSHLTVEKPETLAMLRQDAPQLQRALNDAGLQTSDKGLQFSLSDQSLTGQNNQNGARDSGGRPSQRLIVAEDELPPVVMAGRSYGRLLSSSSGVDIKV
ncbi:MAG: flagellar hook-length control protein, partial [Tardiphaga sp.]|nr:flagellar hook-length control protein [Tardiphaga sp.]